jgi:hypothetical protein
MMRIIFFTIIIIHSFHLCAQSNHFHPQFSVALEPKAGKKTLDQCSRCAPRKYTRIWKVDEQQVQLLEDNFLLILNVSSFNGIGISNLTQYAFQYVGLTIQKKKYIYINSFLARDQQELDKSHPLWQTKAVVVCDGGSGYWGILFELDSHVFFALCINGRA